MHKDIMLSLLHGLGVADLRMLYEWHGAEALRRNPTMAADMHVQRARTLSRASTTGINVML